MLRLYPSIMASTVRHFLQLPIQGVVLQCYGSGRFTFHLNSLHYGQAMFLPTDKTFWMQSEMVLEAEC